MYGINIFILAYHLSTHLQIVNEMFHCLLNFEMREKGTCVRGIVTQGLLINKFIKTVKL